MEIEFNFKNIQHIFIKINNPNCEAARQTLVKFYNDHNEIKFIEAVIQENNYGNIWEIFMETSFECIINNSNNKKMIIDGYWNESGNINTNFIGFEDNPTYSVDCICENNKWYLMFDVFKKKISDLKQDKFDYKIKIQELLEKNEHLIEQNKLLQEQIYKLKNDCSLL